MQFGLQQCFQKYNYYQYIHLCINKTYTQTDHLYNNQNGFSHPEILVHLSLSIWNYNQLLTCTRWRDAIQADSSLPIYSGRKLTRLGRAADWSFLISDAVTLQDSKVSERRFFKGFKYCNPSLVMREFETFSDTKAVKPACSEEKECVRRMNETENVKFDQCFLESCALH